ncbi:hypothetical protein [Acidocella sp.]|uniref:hypothetical protein n=1 Tax=Acidocella sp. TaxID=50710 RepID=UPI00261F19D5|nr:hypothetical protein [Acidocella sp.]
MIPLKPLALSFSLLAAPLALAQTAPGTAAGNGALPGNAVGTRSSLPRAAAASNINPSDTRSTIAPTPPEPAVGPNASVSALLAAANQAIASGQTGTADEAMEQAETQILQRSVPQTQTDYVSQDPVVAQIDHARQALGNKDRAGAMRTINQILASGAPELGG